MGEEANSKPSELPVADLLLKRKRLRRELCSRTGLQPVRVAVLGGSTTQELVELLEILLLEDGFEPSFYQSEYGRYYDDAVQDTEGLEAFRPEVVYVHTSVLNIVGFPPMNATEQEFEQYVQAEFAKFRQIWDSLEEKIGCLIIQNNFELPPQAILGNLDSVLTGGHTRFVNALNAALAKAALSRTHFIVQDVCSISARLGLNRWFDWDRWFSFKLNTSVEGSHALAVSLAALVRAAYGRTRKVLVLDLDNTLWGGIVGDDGADRIQIGRETPVAEAYTAFQRYCLALRERGVLLAVSSKNNEEIALEGLNHPESILRPGDFASLRVNWSPKHENIEQIAADLNLSTESFVFVDDNPAERAIVSSQVKGIAVPDIGSNVAEFIDRIEARRYFEQIAFSAEDLQRAASYQQNQQRADFKERFADYGEYLDSLQMEAEIAEFSPVYMQRIAQLTNKTNQFNLTTRRYTLAELEALAADPCYIGLYGKLVDRFGSNGLVCVVVGRKQDDELHLQLWLMSCRVLKRDMEVAMLDAIVARAQAAGVKRLIGYYLPTRKNAIVAELYSSLGFENVETRADGASTWKLDLAGYQPRSKHIRITQPAHSG